MVQQSSARRQQCPRASHATTHSQLLSASGQAGAAKGKFYNSCTELQAVQTESGVVVIDMPTKIRATASVLLKGGCHQKLLL